jgi:hypothetical protein
MAVAHVNVEIVCPSCGLPLRDWAEFRWGLCSSSSPPDIQYAVGDRLIWGRHDDDFVPSWFRFSDQLSNIGYPSGAPMRLLDRTLPERCWGCGESLGPIVIELAGDAVSEVTLAPDDSYVAGIDAYAVEDGKVVPRSEWDAQLPHIISAASSPFGRITRAIELTIFD